jgi:hypothetical protein
MGVAREVAVAIERSEEEAEHDLAEAVARLPIELADFLEADAVDPLGHEYALGAELRHHPRDVDERVVAPGAREGAVLLGLVLVVELVGEPLADLGGHRLGVHARSDPLGHAHDEPDVLEVGANRVRHARVLHLHRHVATVLQARAVDLPDRRSGHGLLPELGEDVLEPLAKVVLHDLAHLVERHARRGVPQLGELRLDARLELRREGAGIDEGGHLAHLHRRSLHLAEDVEDLLRRLHLAALGGGPAHLLASGQVGRLGGVPAGSLPPCQPSHLRSAAHPAGGDVLGHHPRVRIRFRERCGL